MFTKPALLLTAATTFLYIVAQAQITNSFPAADSLFTQQNWAAAKSIYTQLLSDTSQNSIEWNRLGYCEFKLGNYDAALNALNKSAATNPPAGLLATLYSRLAMVNAIKNNKQAVTANLEKAIKAGYFNFIDLDTMKAYENIRQDEDFKTLRDKVYFTAYPCMADTLRRQFDFWVGEWDAYVTGTHFLAGHSIIQVASGGCMILENWTAANVPYTGKSMNFIDAATHKWQQVWVGAEGGPQHVFINGGYRDSAMRFEFEQTNAQGKKLKGRFIFFNQGPNQVRQLNETSGDDGKTWTTVYDFTYIRKK
ncbi:MAG TPA: tetratricopeptide repeat protein [Chitinophagaceae bacterium]|nr:tetratricopeptide repeat protein [Chitinophagaceae bacterium]